MILDCDDDDHDYDYDAGSGKILHLQDADERANRNINVNTNGNKTEIEDDTPLLSWSLYPMKVAMSSLLLGDSIIRDTTNTDKDYDAISCVANYIIARSMKEGSFLPRNQKKFMTKPKEPIIHYHPSSSIITIHHHHPSSSSIITIHHHHPSSSSSSSWNKASSTMIMSQCQEGQGAYQEPKRCSWLSLRNQSSIIIHHHLSSPSIIIIHHHTS